MTVSRGEIRKALEQRPYDETWERVREWTRTLQPFWIEAIRRFSEVAEIPDRRRDACLAAAEGAIERMDDWWYGRVRLVKARRNEIDSAISLTRNNALDNDLAYLIQAPVARHVAGALRPVLTMSVGDDNRERLPTLTASLVYDWACARTLFPGSGFVMLQHLSDEDRADEGFSGNDPERFDTFHLIFGAPADLFGLRAEGDAVFAEAERIWNNFDTPLPWRLPEDIWTRPYDGTYQRMHFQDIARFHGR